MLLPLFSFSETQTTHRENGEEVYVPKKEESQTNDRSQNKKETQKENTPAKEKQSKANPKEKDTKPEEAHETKAPIKGESSHKEKAAESKEKMERAPSKETNKYMANKIVSSDEEDPYEIHKPIGILWFCAVFVVLLIVIFIFT